MKKLYIVGTDRTVESASMVNLSHLYIKNNISSKLSLYTDDTTLFIFKKSKEYIIGTYSIYFLKMLEQWCKENVFEITI